jgi:rubredoxin
MDPSASSPQVRPEARDGADDRANELYWGSDLSVNQIAEALDLSKGALYEMIRPLPADLACPLCGAEAVHPNRTAHERGLIVCPSCGWEGDDAQGAPLTPTSPPTSPPSSSQGLSPRTGPPVRPGLTAPLVIGAAVGVALLFWALRRR